MPKLGYTSLQVNLDDRFGEMDYCTEAVSPDVVESGVKHYLPDSVYSGKIIGREDQYQTSRTSAKYANQAPSLNGDYVRVSKQEYFRTLQPPAGLIHGTRSTRETPERCEIQVSDDDRAFRLYKPGKGDLRVGQESRELVGAQLNVGQPGPPLYSSAQRGAAPLTRVSSTEQVSKSLIYDSRCRTMPVDVNNVRSGQHVGSLAPSHEQFYN